MTLNRWLFGLNLTFGILNIMAALDGKHDFNLLVGSVNMVFALVIALTSGDVLPGGPNDNR
jgi:hypothetical protein